MTEPKNEMRIPTIEETVQPLVNLIDQISIKTGPEVRETAIQAITTTLEFQYYANKVDRSGNGMARVSEDEDMTNRYFADKFQRQWMELGIMFDNQGSSELFGNITRTSREVYKQSENLGYNFVHILGIINTQGTTEK